MQLKVSRVEADFSETMSKWPAFELSVYLFQQIFANLSHKFEKKWKLSTAKGQLILEFPFGVFKSSKKPTKIVQDFR